MTHIFNMQEAKSSLSKLVALVEAGEEVQIARNGVPVVELSLPTVTNRPLFGEYEPVIMELPIDFDIATQEEIEAMEEAMDRKDKILLQLMEELALEKASAR